MRKYEFTDDEKIVEGQKVRQIRALVDIPKHGVAAGDLGGWQTTENLPHDGDSWMCPEAVLLDSKVLGDTLIRRGVIEKSEVHARLILCKSIRRSKVDGAAINIRLSAVLLDTILETTADMEVSAGVYLERVKIYATGYVWFGEDAHLLLSTLKGADLHVGDETTIKGCQVEGNDIKIEQASKLNKVQIKGNKIELKHCDFHGVKIDGEDVKFLRVKFHEGRVKAKSLAVRYGWDIHNTHLQGENIRMEGTGSAVLHNASIHCTHFKMLGEFDIDWVFFEGEDIELDGIVKLEGIYQNSLHKFDVKGNVKIIGSIEMKMNETPIILKDETIEGDFKFVS